MEGRDRKSFCPLWCIVSTPHGEREARGVIRIGIGGSKNCIIIEELIYFTKLEEYFLTREGGDGTPRLCTSLKTWCTILMRHCLSTKPISTNFFYWLLYIFAVVTLVSSLLCTHLYIYTDIILAVCASLSHAMPMMYIIVSMTVHTHACARTHTHTYTHNTHMHTHTDHHADHPIAPDLQLNWDRHSSTFCIYTSAATHFICMLSLRFLFPFLPFILCYLFNIFFYFLGNFHHHQPALVPNIEWTAGHNLSYLSLPIFTS